MHVVAVWMLIALALSNAPAIAQSAHDHAAHGQAGAASGPPAPVRMTMEALHAAGGTPPGWRFTVPPGDVSAGRQAFADFKCYACHAIKGESFGSSGDQMATAGPELTGMGGHHPAGYLAESIVNPSAVVIDQPGYIGGDGRSIMPMYPDMTLAQLINLVAYLKSLGGGEAVDQAAVREQVVGGYRVRLSYRAPDAHAHHHGTMAMPPAKGRVMVFLTDAASGQPIPYAEVSASIDGPGKPSRSVKLTPAFGSEGFHYGADADLPGAAQISVSIRPTTMQLGAGAPEGLKRPQRVTFDWK
jgi:hypothetical protein